MYIPKVEEENKQSAEQSCGISVQSAQEKDSVAAPPSKKPKRKSKKTAQKPVVNEEASNGQRLSDEAAQAHSEQNKNLVINFNSNFNVNLNNVIMQGANNAANAGNPR